MVVIFETYADKYASSTVTSANNSKVEAVVTTWDSMVE